MSANEPGVFEVLALLAKMRADGLIPTPVWLTPTVPWTMWHPTRETLVPR